MRMPSDSWLRIIDANAHRLNEGLRVLMDVARFALDHHDLSKQLKLLRHRLYPLLEQLPEYHARAAAARAPEADVGRAGQFPGHRLRHGLADVYRANLHRAEEAARTLEEMLATASAELSAAMQSMRFELYQLDQQMQPLVARLALSDKLDFELYVVTSPELHRGRSMKEVVEAALEGGAGAIQLRAKEFSKRQLWEAARVVRELTFRHRATFIVNDHLDVALAVGADGVHLGQEDLPLPAARQVAGPGFILGASTHNVEEALAAEAEGADYINVGPIFPTQSKAVAVPPVGAELITQVKAAVHIPQTCMGGISRANVRQVILAGAERVAVVSAVVSAADVKAATKELRQLIKVTKRERDGVDGTNSSTDFADYTDSE